MAKMITGSGSVPSSELKARMRKTGNRSAHLHSQKFHRTAPTAGKRSAAGL